MMQVERKSSVKSRLFYLWLLPLLWGIFTAISFFYSGDEHALFAYGSLAGTWICFLHEFKTLEQALIPVLATGTVFLALIGLLLDWLRVKKRLWLFVFFLIAVLIFIFQFRMYGSIERIRSKHGYVLGLVIVACNWGIYGAIMFSVSVTLLGRLIGLVRRAPVNQKR